jgi:hypothetical protein
VGRGTAIRFLAQFCRSAKTTNLVLDCFKSDQARKG